MFVDLEQGSLAQPVALIPRQSGAVSLRIKFSDPRPYALRPKP